MRIPDCVGLVMKRLYASSIDISIRIEIKDRLVHGRSSRAGASEGPRRGRGGWPGARRRPAIDQGATPLPRRIRRLDGAGSATLMGDRKGARGLAAAC